MAQAIVSPVAYVPADFLQKGYRVIAEISRGWVGPGVPFYKEGLWRLSRRISLSGRDNILYIEGGVGKLSVYQGKRLLFRGAAPMVWIPLIDTGETEVRIEGERGGITGGIYLLGRTGSVGWPAEPYPPSLPHCNQPLLYFSESEALKISPLRHSLGRCWGYPFLPPARVQKVLHSQHHQIALGSYASPSQPRLLSLPAFAILWGGLAFLFSLFPLLHTAFWHGLFTPRPTNPIESFLGLIWSLGALASLFLPSKESLFWLISVSLLIEAVFLKARGMEGHWVWQSLLLPLALSLLVGLLYPSVLFGLAFGLWVSRALCFIRRITPFAYLWALELFIAIFVLYP